MFRVEPGGYRLDHAELRNHKVICAVLFSVPNPGLVCLLVPQSYAPARCPKVHSEGVPHIGLVFLNQAREHVRGYMRVCTIEKLLPLGSARARPTESSDASASRTTDRRCRTRCRAASGRLFRLQEIRCLSQTGLQIGRDNLGGESGKLCEP